MHKQKRRLPKGGGKTASILFPTRSRGKRVVREKNLATVILIFIHASIRLPDCAGRAAG